MTPTKKPRNIDYKKSGVQYDLLDPFKIRAQKAAAATDGNGEYLHVKSVPESRGESAFLTETEHGYIAYVEETLGTKNLIADAMQTLTGKSHYDAIAIDAVGAIVNDMISVGALPISLAMHIAVGDSRWFANEDRSDDLINGWKKGCDLSSTVWAGGETPTLQGIVERDTVLLSGSAIGIIRKKEQVIQSKNLKDGDRIILLQSSGIHANGASLCRALAEKLPKGYETKLPDERMFGEAALDPTVIYVPIMRSCIEEGIRIHYASHITGHGLRKIMRAVEPFAYVLERLPEPPAIFPFLQKHSGMSDTDMYGTFNMGAGFALFVAPEDVKAILKICAKNKIGALDAGYVQASQEKKLSLLQKKIEYAGGSLAVR